VEGKKLYVGNLNYSVTNDELMELFSAYGEVQQVNIIEGKGFGFVEMASSAEAQQAQEALNNTEFRGRTLRIDEARPPQNRDRDRGGQRQGDRNNKQRSPRRF
jgi:RNA recognition motif-containing protein